VSLIGDLCPLRENLALLRRFFAAARHRHNSISLRGDLRTMGTPVRRRGRSHPASTSIRAIRASSTWICFRCVSSRSGRPDFCDFRFTLDHAGTDARLCQCVIRDTARRTPARNYYGSKGARSWTVSDQLMKKELIVQGMGWDICRVTSSSGNWQKASSCPSLANTSRAGQIELGRGAPSRRTARPDCQSAVAIHR